MYAKDTWRVGQRLTLNLGVRYDHYHVFNESRAGEPASLPPPRHFPSWMS